MTNSSYIQKSLNFFTKPLVLCSLVVLAETGSARNICPAGIASSTVYFVPHVKDYCPTARPCARFKRQVRMQGSGSLPGNKLLTYNGKIVDLGSCSTAFGASGNCLIPYISVAADPRYYSMGDIIEMPNLKGKVVTLPNGKKMIHPGFLVVHDTGGAIKGSNRFDFFTGSLGMRDSQNSFGARAGRDVQMLDKTDCSLNKRFSIVRRSSGNYNNAVVAIEDSLRNLNASSEFMVASAFKGAR